MHASICDMHILTDMRYFRRPLIRSSHRDCRRPQLRRFVKQRVSASRAWHWDIRNILNSSHLRLRYLNLYLVADTGARISSVVRDDKPARGCCSSRRS